MTDSVPANHLIVVRELDFSYPNGRPVLKGASLEVDRGDFMVLRGPSGGGKSTLLRLLTRLETPLSGRIEFRGEPLETLDPRTLRRSMVLLQQQPVLVPGSVRRNLLLPFSLDAANGDTPPADAALRRHLDDFLLQDVELSAPARELSVGQRQRLCLIRAMLLRPEVLLLDEPTASLDPASASVVLGRAERLNREEELTVILVSHGEHQPQVPRYRSVLLRGAALEVR